MRECFSIGLEMVLFLVVAFFFVDLQHQIDFDGLLRPSGMDERMNFDEVVVEKFISITLICASELKIFFFE